MIHKLMRIVAKAILLVAVLTVQDASYADLIALYQFNDPSNLGKDSSGYGHDAQDFGATYTSTGYQGGGGFVQWLVVSEGADRRQYDDPSSIHMGRLGRAHRH